MEFVSNPDLQLAFDFIKFTNRNIFLTGKAGTGKTTFLHELKKTLPKRMVVLAPTGVAAINARGVTIHSFFQLPFHPFIPALYIPGVNHDKRAEHDTYKLNREKINIIKSLDLLVIDEISMVRADILDAIDASLRRYRNHDLPFGGVQLLMIGDLQQLAPVAKEEDMEILGKYYDVLFFFGSRALKSTDFVTIELKHIYRQSDQLFIDLLNKVRENRLDSFVLNELNKRYIPEFDPDSGGGYITLTTHNHQAKTLNDSRLEKLPGKPHSFSASVTDDFPEASYPNVGELILKKGAQVMFVKNDISKDKLFFNGKIGKVEYFEDDVIVVRCPGDDFPIMVEMAEWQNVKYTLDDETKEIGETVIGTFRQYPLKLAWAITIHKSQGLTFDRAVIDARSAFAHGQVYVALSRCRTLEGLVLSSKIDQRCIIGNPSVSGFIRETEKNQPGQKELDESRKAYQKMLLSELFDFTPLVRLINNCIRVADEHKESIQGNPQELLMNALTSVKKDLIEVSEKFEPHIRMLMSDDPDSECNARLQERVMKACEFFSVKLEAAFEGITTGFSVETDNKAVRKAFNEVHDRLKKENLTKLACLNKVKSGFMVSEYLDVRAKSAIEKPAAGSRTEKTGNQTRTIQHPGLYRRLKEWRAAKAGELDLAEYMVLPGRTMVALTGALPQTMADLKLVKGMGRKKPAKFGNEILEIICSYCKKEKIEPPAEAPAKKPKKVREDSDKITLRLFREGKTIQQIAEERRMALTTIEGHLAHFVGSGEIPLSGFVTPEKADIIIKHFDGSEDLRLGPVKEILGEQVSWSELRFVSNHIRFLRSCVEK
ncbi:MAG TPA: helix-turn-helix domain-containing protein [Bacteroidales bacterium]|nr:helix-turn-helix domain-containing protein [Bacteroidales bacterium]